MSPVIGAFAVITRRWCLRMPSSATTLVLGTCVAFPMGLLVLEPVVLMRTPRVLSRVSPVITKRASSLQLFSV